jgi:hypothetical protein
MSKTFQFVLLAAGLLVFAWIGFAGEEKGNSDNGAQNQPSGTPLFSPRIPASLPGAGLASPGMPPISTGALNPAHGQPGHRCDLAVGAPLPAANISPSNGTASQAPAAGANIISAASPATPAGKNPPHGQPGHRCDIAVGAPLDSKPPVQANQVASAAQPAIAPAQQQNKTAATAPGMNPPHGQPGHRCDIAVGASLSSKPAATTKSSAVATPAAAPISPVQQALASGTPPVTTPPGKNPPHGQPGHRCDIAVGASLDSAKKQ